MIPGVPPLGSKTELLEGLEFAASLLDLDVSANLGVGTTFELDPEEITVRLLDPAGAVVGEGPIGTSFPAPVLSAATDEAVELIAEYRLDATLTQALTVVPSLTMPGKIGAVSASAAFDVFGLSLGATEVSAAFAESEDLFDLLGFDPLESLGFDTSEGRPLPGTEVSAPLEDLVPPEALVLTRDIVIPSDTGPDRTATTPILGPDGPQIGSQGLTLPSYTTDGTVDYRVTLSTQAQATQYNIAFIIDRSGSMNDEDKIEAAKAAFLDLIDFLEAEGIAAAANFAVIPFNDRASLSDGLSPEAAVQLISGISATGNTAFGPPLTEAERFFSGAPSGSTNIAYFLSDGQSNNDESASLQAFADVRAFALGSNAATAALDVIDSNTAEDLSAPSDLADAFGASGVETAALDRVETRVDGALADTIPVESFTDTPLGLSYEGGLSGIAATDPSDNVQARMILETGAIGSVIDLEITDGGPSGTPGSGPDRLAMARTATEIDASGGDDAVTGNSLGNVIVLGPGDDTADGGPGDDLIRPGDDGDDRISGGLGIDTVAYDGTLDEIGPVSREGSLVRVGKGTDVLDGVEFVRFADTRISTDTLGAAPEISAMVTGAAEPLTGTADATLSLQLSEPFASDRVVTLATAPGTAEPGLDYVPLAGTIPIPAGTTELQVPLPILADDLVEGRETFVLDLAAPTDATFANVKAARQLEVSIVDEDRPGELSVRVPEPQVSEPRAGESANIAFEVVRGGDTRRPGSVDWRVEGTGTAPADPDDIALPAFAGGRVFLSAGETMARIALPVAADALDEGSEGLRLILSNPSDGLRIVDRLATAVLRDPQPPIDSTGTPEVSLDAIALDSERVEGNTGTTAFRFEISRSGETGLPVAVDWLIEGNGADGADFVGGTLPSGRIDFAAGEVRREIRIDVAGDRIDEGDEAFTFRLGNADAGTATAVIAAGPVDAVINDDDGPAANLAIVPVEAVRPEGDADSTPFTLEVSRTGDTNGDLSVDYAVSGADPEDFTGGVRPSGTVSFADGETTKTVTVDVQGDTAVEPDEGFTVALSNASAGAQITTASAGGTILNDDAPPPAELAIGPLQAARAEGDAGTTAFTFEVTRSVNTTGPLTVDWAVSGADAADFAGGVRPSGTASFADGETTKTITVDVQGDTAVEPDEGFTVALSNASGDAQITAASAAGTILNDDDGVAAPAGVVRGTGRDDALLLGAGATYLGGAGADLFLQSGAATPGETALIEGRAGDVIQFAPGLGIVEFALQEDALQLDLATGARLRVLNAGSVDFEAGGNVSTGETGQRDDFAGFAADVLGTPLPAGGSVSGGPVTIPPATGTAPGIAEPGEPAGPIGVIRGTERPDALMTGAGATYLGGAADDLFLVSRAATPGETALIEGAAGDVIQLAPDLAIEAFAAQDDALQLDLAGGARARILNADRLDFSVGGNATTGTAGLSQGFGAFLGTTLGISMPGEGETLTGGPLRIGTPSGTPVESAGTIQGEPGPNDFVLKVDKTNGVPVTNPDFTGQATLDFEPGVDTLVLENVPGSTVTESDFFTDPNDLGDDLFDAVVEDVFNPSVNLIFGIDLVLGGAGAQVLIPGIGELDTNDDQQLDFIEVV